MQHAKDIALFIVTILAASLAAGVLSYIAVVAYPTISEAAIGTLYLTTLFVLEILAGAHLMAHMRVPYRLLILTLGPLAAGMVAAIMVFLNLQPSAPITARLLFVMEARAPWLVISAGVALGALLVWWRQRRAAVSAA